MRRTHRDFCSGRTQIKDEATEWIVRECSKCGQVWKYARCLAATRSTGQQCRSKAVLPCDAPKWCTAHSLGFRRKVAAP